MLDCTNGRCDGERVLVALFLCHGVNARCECFKFTEDRWMKWMTGARYLNALLYN